MLLTMGLCLTVLGQDLLPGSNLSLRQAKAEAQFVVVADVIGPAELIVGVGAVSFWSGMELETSTALKGKESRDEIRLVSGSVHGGERMPRKGETLVVFLIEFQQKGNFQVIKVLPKTEETLKELKAP